MTGIIALLLLLAPRANAACTAMNPDTGACDAGGSLCSQAIGGTNTALGVCCDNILTECNSSQAQQIQSNATGGTSVTTPDVKADVVHCGVTGIRTALGCIPITQTGFFEFFFRIGIGIAGGIAFLLIIYGGLKMMLSAGNPEQLNEAKEMVTSAVTGLLLIIFSVFILQFIGVNILGASLGFGG